MDTETGQWTTPDAYAGEVDDPMTQKPFMWNRNNPYPYSDPSGYCTNRAAQVQAFLSSFIFQAASAFGLRGNNRGTSGDRTRANDSYKGRVVIGTRFWHGERL